MEHAYLCLLQELLHEGEPHEDRTGVGTRSLFGRQLRCDLGAGFPLLTTKRVPFKGTFHELKWFLSGSTNIRDLHSSVQKWWSPWADEHGSLGPIYGEQLRNHYGLDQIKQLLEQIERSPESRRIIATTWSPNEVQYMQLPPCHGLVIQLKVHTKSGRIDLSMYQRSADIFIGVPVNIASYALLLHLICWLTGYIPGDLVLTFGDVHLYENHVPQAKLQLTRFNKVERYPTLKLVSMPKGDTSMQKLINFELENLELVGYDPMGSIPAPLAI